MQAQHRTTTNHMIASIRSLTEEGKTEVRGVECNGGNEGVGNVYLEVRYNVAETEHTIGGGFRVELGVRVGTWESVS